MSAQTANREMRLVESGIREQEIVDTKMQESGIDVKEERKSLEYLEQDVEREKTMFSSLLKVGWKAVQQLWTIYVVNEM